MIWQTFCRLFGKFFFFVVAAERAEVNMCLVLTGVQFDHSLQSFPVSGYTINTSFAGCNLLPHTWHNSVTEDKHLYSTGNNCCVIHSM